MRLKTALWVAAYLRRCHVEGIFAVVRRRGAEEAGAVFVRVSRLDGTLGSVRPGAAKRFRCRTRGGARIHAEPCQRNRRPTPTSRPISRGR